MKECCANCKYYERDNNGFHRHPFICKNESGTEYAVPVYADDVCDDYTEDKEG